ncbi:SRPBCC domain-containing protein [Streptosporangium sp. NPDC048047]|uniref:SRPBCC family protein n=1 Tax=Streptosporangium sp. NPDC048047 TaxID=3155748 RepID=UPI003423389C
MNDEPFSIEITVAAPVGDVWAALRDPERIRRWHGWLFDGLDEEVELIYGREATESAADHRLEVQGGDRFELTGLGDRTRLRLTRPPRGADPEWDAYYDEITEGWITFVQQLRFALERHPGHDRRTVFLSGTGASPVLEAAGLTAVADLTPGSRYELTVPAGETLRGEVWFRSGRQLGLTVDGWGDGLLVAAQNPPSRTGSEGSGGTGGSGGSGGSALMVLTAYDLDDAAFSGLESRWASWWDRTFPVAAPV